MMEKQIDVLTSAWKMYQDLAKGFAESCWKIRSIGIGFWSAIIAYGYKENDGLLYYFSLFIIFVFFLMESGTRRIQNKYISKSIEIEKSINDFLVGADLKLPSEGISTNIEIPSLTDFCDLLSLKRWMFWLPYLTILVISIILIYVSI